MNTNPLQRLAVVLSTGVLLTGFAAAPTALAAPSQRIQSTLSDVSCVFETTQTDLVYFGASASSGGSGSWMFVETVDYDMVLDSPEAGTAVFGADGSFSAEVPLISVKTGEPAGTATVEGVRTAVGEPVAREVRDRSGNVWEEKGTVVVTDYQVDVTSVVVPGYDVQVGEDDCTSEDMKFDVRKTNPAAQIYRDNGFYSEICELEGLEFGGVLLDGRSLREPGFQVVIDDGVTPQKAEGSVPLRGGSGEATTELIDLTTEETIADLTISVDLARDNTRQIETETVDGVTFRTALTSYVATIEVVTSDGRQGTAECTAVAYADTIIMRPGSGGDGH